MDESQESPPYSKALKCERCSPFQDLPRSKPSTSLKRTQGAALYKLLTKHLKKKKKRHFKESIFVLECWVINTLECWIINTRLLLGHVHVAFSFYETFSIQMCNRETRKS